ncbi:MAG: hypothetical protein ACYDDZ_13050, partial [Acidimicrobiales bacterium]
MNEVREYRTPLLIGAGTVVIALLLWAVVISPQNSKLSKLQSQQTSLQNQQIALQTKLSVLRTEQQKLTSSCTQLQKIATQIPSVQTPTDVDAEESSFESQFNALAASAGVSLTKFSGFSPATSISGSPASGTTSAASTATPAGVVAVPTTLSVSGTYGQILAFVNGLDSFPRLFVIQTFQLSVSTGTSSGSAGSGPASSASASSASATGAPSFTAPPLWTGGNPPQPGTQPFALAIDGSIYYTTQ